MEWVRQNRPGWAGEVQKKPKKTIAADHQSCLSVAVACAAVGRRIEKEGTAFGIRQRRVMYEAQWVPLGS